MTCPPWRPTIDMMGLNDAHIGRVDLVAIPELAGHLKGDGGHVLDRAPQVIFSLRLVVRVETFEGHPAFLPKDEDRFGWNRLTAPSAPDL